MSIAYSVDQVLAAGAEIAEYFERTFIGAKYSSNELLRTRACLCLSVGEGYRALIALLSSRGQSYAPVVLRAMFEAVADLKILCEDSEHLEQMQFVNAKQYLRTFREFRDDEAAAIDAAGKQMLDAAVAIEQAIHDQLRSVERTRFSIRDKFERAGMRDLYRSVYAYLCSFSHNNINTLRQRHGASGNLSFADPLSPRTALQLLGVGSAGYANALLLAPHFSTLTDSEASTANTWMWRRLEQLDSTEISSVKPQRPTIP